MSLSPQTQVDPWIERLLTSDSHQALHAIHRGETSKFERTFWYAMDPPALVTSNQRWPGYSLTVKSIMQTLVQLPRLVLRTRNASQHPSNQMVHRDASLLGLELFCGSNPNSIDEWFKLLLQAQAVWTVPTQGTYICIQEIAPQSYHFASPRLYQLLLQHWVSRLIICGCVQRLGAGPGLDMAKICQTRIDAATQIAACAKYCLLLDQKLPCALTMQLTALRVSYGT